MSIVRAANGPLSTLLEEDLFEAFGALFQVFHVLPALSHRQELESREVRFRFGGFDTLSRRRETDLAEHRLTFLRGAPFHPEFRSVGMRRVLHDGLVISRRADTVGKLDEFYRRAASAGDDNVVVRSRDEHRVLAADKPRKDRSGVLAEKDVLCCKLAQKLGGERQLQASHEPAPAAAAARIVRGHLPFEFWVQQIRPYLGLVARGDQFGVGGNGKDRRAEWTGEVSFGHQIRNKVWDLRRAVRLEKAQVAQSLVHAGAGDDNVADRAPRLLFGDDSFACFAPGFIERLDLNARIALGEGVFDRPQKWFAQAVDNQLSFFFRPVKIFRRRIHRGGEYFVGQESNN